MRLSQIQLPDYPEPSGGHRLAWAYLLDLIFADAVRAGLASLHISLPHPDLEPEVTLRAHGSQATKRSRGHGVVTFRAEPTDASIDRLYLLGHGLLAPRHLRRRQEAKLEGWRCSQRLYVLTWSARLYGVIMSVLNRAGRPYLADKVMFSMRSVFASSTPTSSYYQLTIWEKS